MSHVRWITDLGALRALAPAWAALCDSCPSSTPFERPEWLLPWIEIFGAGCALRILAIERAGALAALLPLAAADHRGETRLSFVGSWVSDYHDAVLAEDDPELRAELWDALAAADWSVCVLDCLRSGSPMLGALPGAAAARIADDEGGEQAACPILRCAPGARDVADVLPEGFAHRLARLRRKAEREHRLTVRAAGSRLEAQALFDVLCVLHGARWRDRGAAGALADDDVQRFHRRVIDRMWTAGRLRLSGLELDGALAAVVYGFTAHGRMTFYLGGFDSRHATSSPGSLLIAANIERQLAEGDHLFDFLRGRESYKYRFGAKDAPCYGRVLRRSPRGR
jgi:CelD/BcsL family acetyltransferase involved in cellulose biosynthesis